MLYDCMFMQGVINREETKRVYQMKVYILCLNQAQGREEST